MKNPRTEDVPSCILCGATGKVIYKDLQDRLFGVPGVFRFRQCSACQLLWLDPRPIREDLQRCYQNYYTHSTEARDGYDDPSSRPMASWRDALRMAILCGHYGYRHVEHRHMLCRFGPFLAKSKFLRYRAVYDDLRECLSPFPGHRDGFIIDIGCGSGDYLKRMKDLGWIVLGIEPDVVAAGIAQSKGIPVIIGTMEGASLSSETANQITMNHVMEHLPDPLATIRECLRVLKRGGRLVIYTPNQKSLGHLSFREAWRGLEPPRHLFIFSSGILKAALQRCGFEKVKSKSISLHAKGIYDASVLLSKGISPSIQLEPQEGRLLFYWKESFLCRAGWDLGEEVEAVAYKP